MSTFKDNFYSELTKSLNSQTGPAIKPWTREKVLEVIQHVKNAKATIQSENQRKNSQPLFWHLRYDVITKDKADILILKKDSPKCPTVQVIPMEDYFDTLFQIHIDQGHIHSDKINDVVKDKFAIAKKIIDLFVSLCSTCKSERDVIPKEGIGDYNERGQIGVVDMQSVPEGQFKWILIYQDHATKFTHLRPICSKEAGEIAFELLKIFLEFGAPYILQSEDEIGSSAEIVKELVELWPTCKTISSETLPQTQDSIVSISQEIESMIWSWMRESISSDWVTGCFFLQYKMNKQFHKVLGKSPFQSLFGSGPTVPVSPTLNNSHASILASETTAISQTISSPATVLLSSPTHSMAKKRKITSGDTSTLDLESSAQNKISTERNTDSPINETGSQEVSSQQLINPSHVPILAPSPSNHSEKYRAHTLKENEKPTLGTKSQELSQSLSSTLFTKPTSPQNDKNDPSRTEVTLRSSNQELTQRIPLPLHTTLLSHENQTNDVTSNEEKILQYLRNYLPVTAINLLFASYAETFKTFSPKKQADLKVDLAKLFSEAEIK